jgi:hypothetical protein
MKYPELLTKACLLWLICFCLSCSNEKPGSNTEISDQMPGLWYQQPLRILQTVLREPDASDYNVDSMISYMNRIHANVLVINGGGIVDYFQNTLPLANVNQYIGSRDLLADIVNGCHQNNIKVIARIDFRGVDKARYELHPDWFARDDKGNPIILDYTTPPLYAPCYNSYYRNEHAVDFISVLLNKYKVDGIWHNAVNFPQTCYCGRCKAKYLKFSGKKIPTKSDPDAEWNEYYRWKAADAAEQLELMRSTVKKSGEDKAYAAEVFDMYDVNQQKKTGIDLYSAAKYFDFLVTVSFMADNSAELDYKDISYASEIVKFLKALDPDKSPVILFGGNGTEHRYVYDPPADLRQWLWEAAGSGGGFWNCYFNGAYPAVTLDTRNSFLVSDAFMYLQKNNNLVRDLIPVTDIGIFYSKATAQLVGDKAFAEPLKGMLRIMQDGHIQYGFVTDYNLTPEALSRFKILIMPDVGFLDPGQASMITDWVKSGGQLIATYQTSLLDENGNISTDFILSDLYGAHYTGTIADTETDSYQKIMTRNSIMAGFNKTSLLHNGGKTLICKMDTDAEMITGYIPRINNQPPEYAYPESWDTDIPVIVYHKSVKGSVIYFANQPGKLNYTTGHPDYHDMIMNSIHTLTGGKLSLTTNAPAAVHIYLNRNRKDPSLYQLSLVNTASAPARPIRDIVPVNNIKIEFPFKIEAINSMSDNPVAFHMESQSVIIDRLIEFEAFSIKIK